ncbi:MAG: outer membrane protein transport protein, partial [Granulosicoccaceae bacterium]
MNFRKSLLALTVAATLAPLSAQATNGYFSIGYGAKARGIAGAATALPQDSMAAAVNPAGIAHVGNRADVNVNIFSPVREAQSAFSKNNPNPMFATGTNLNSDSSMNGFIIPSGGYVRELNDQMSAGITIYANGGMNTYYENDTVIGPVNLFGAQTNLGVDLAQLIFAPTIAYKINDTHSVGAALLVGYQRFKAYGLQNFCGLKADGTCNPMTGVGIGTDAANKGLTDQGYDDAWGVGVRIGWQGNISDKLTLGAAYSSKIYMDEFDKYDKLFAEDGDFDIPANWSVGLAYKATPKVTVSADIQHIQYSDVKSIANAGPAINAMNVLAVDGMNMMDATYRLGADDGLGFGWDDMTILKVGAIYEYNDKFTYRFGLSHGEQPIDDDQLAFNILAPAVVETHLTAGFSYRPSGKD